MAWKRAKRGGGATDVYQYVWRRVRRRLERVGQGEFVESIENAPVVGRWVRDRDEYEEGMDEAVRQELLELCEPKIQRTEDFLDLDLSHCRAT